MLSESALMHISKLQSSKIGTNNNQLNNLLIGEHEIKLEVSFQRIYLTTILMYLKEKKV